VLEEHARAREAPLPRGEWIDLWTHEHVEGGGTVRAEAPLARIPVWVRAGTIVVTHPAAHVARGLGDTAERERPLEATLWGRPALGRACAKLADGTRIGWHDGDWSIEEDREVTVRSVP
jgi:hypothetical protein